MSPLDPPNLSPEQDAFDAEMMPAGPAPMSGMAIAGFVSSVTVCCPVFSPLLALIFSLVGLSQTKGGARRGRGLAIAGLIISLLVAPLQGWGIIVGVNGASGFVSLQSAMNELQGGNLDAMLSQLYQLGSDKLASSVSEDEFTKWVHSEFSARGGLQNIAIAPQQRGTQSPDGKSIRMQWSAQFAEGTTPVFVDLGFDYWGHLTIETLVIGDTDLRDNFSGNRDSLDDEEPAIDAEPGAGQ